MEKCAQTNFQLLSELVVALGIWTVFLRNLCFFAVLRSLVKCCLRSLVDFWEPSMTHSCESSRSGVGADAWNFSQVSGYRGSSAQLVASLSQRLVLPRVDRHMCECFSKITTTTLSLLSWGRGAQ